MPDRDILADATLAGHGPVSNAAAIADLLGGPTHRPEVSDERRGTRWRWMAAVALVVAAAVFLAPQVVEIAAIFRADREANISDLPTHLVERRNLVVTVTEEGSLVSDNNVDITCDVAGGATIIWLVDDGARVTKGMEIVRLDASVLSENATAQKIAYEKARALMIQAEKDHAAAKIAVEEYREGLFKKDLRTAESNVTAATERLQGTRNTLAYGERMFRKGYITPQQLEAQKSAVARAELDLGTTNIALDVLTRFTRPKMITELESVRDAAAARLESERAALELEKLKLERLLTELEKCTIVAPQDGIAIYSNSRNRDRETEIKAGAAVKERQAILQLPDLANMRADVEVHESKVNDIRPGMAAAVRVQGEEFAGEVMAVANRPQSNWFSTAKKYIVEVKIDGQSPSLRPGFTAEAEIVVADLHDVIAVPVAAVIEQGDEYVCAVQSATTAVRRVVTLGQSDDKAVEIVAGLAEGERVFMNPRSILGDAPGTAPSEATDEAVSRPASSRPSA